ncbi:hypothetical protein Tco_0569438 [Tanacetum coccineum]
MVVQVQAEIGKGSANPTDPHHTPTIIQPSTCQPQKKQKPRKPKRKDTQIPQSSAPTDNVADEAVNEEMDDSLKRAATTATSLDVECQETMGDTIAQTRSENVSKLSNDPLLARGNTLRSDEDSLKLNELMPLCTNLQQRVLDLETIKTTQTNEIASLKKRVKKLERRNKSRTHGLKRMYRVGSSIRVESSEDEGLGEDNASKQGRITDIDANKDIYLVNVHTDEDMFGVNDLDGDEVIVDNVDVVKTTEETRSVVEEVTAIIEKAKLVSTAEETVSTASKFRGSKRTREELEQESSKKQKVEEDKESEELNQCLEIVSDDEDDVTIDATPLSIKSPTIIDYKIYQERKKRYFQIIRADVKARFKKTEPVNYMDNLLLHHLKTMFEHHVEDNVWKNQQGLVKVLNWKLYDSCGVHCVTVQSIPFYLLVEKIYPLTNHTLHQMFNDVKLQVDYECEMAFELLRLGRIVELKRLLDDLRVTAAKLMLLVYKLLLLVLKVNTASTKVTTAQRLRLLK